MNDIIGVFSGFADHLRGKLRAIGNANFGAQMTVVYGEVDKGVQYADDQGKMQGLAEPACKSGCSKCCELGVSVVAEEAINIGRAINKDQERAAKVLAGIDKNQEARKEHNFIPDIAFAATPCVFLEDNLCSIYDIRPLGCRSHHSFDLDACYQIDKATKRNTLRDAVSGVTEQVMHQVRFMHARPQLELEDAIGIYLKDPELAEARFAENKQPFFNSKKWATSGINPVFGK